MSSAYRKPLTFVLLSVLLALIYPGFSQAFELSGSLNANEELQYLKSLSGSLSSRVLSYNYPLGGTPGTEIGLSLLQASNADGSRFGNGQGSETLTLPIVSLSQGTYNNVDLRFEFLPYDQQRGLGHFGGSVFWTFFEGSMVPYTLSMQFHSSNTNLSNQLRVENLGASFLTTFFVSETSVYFGIGPLLSRGRFTSSETLSIQQLRTQAGVSFLYGSYFFAIEATQTAQMDYGLRLGQRFD